MTTLVNLSTAGRCIGTSSSRRRNEKLSLTISLLALTLAIGYTLGGLRSGKIATEQAYHSDLSFFVAINKHLKKNEIGEGKKVSAMGIRGALSVLETFENDSRSSLVFVLPSSETLLDRETKENIRSQAELAVSDEVASKGHIKTE